MKVFVLSQENRPLMPTTPRRARIWLKAKRAKVVSREPFTVRLTFETTEYTQPVVAGVDTGSRTVGVAATTNGEAVYQAEVSLRTDIKNALIRRRQYRRNRRNRKTRYRKARFSNRRRPSGWLPPSLRSKAEATVRAVCAVGKTLPVSYIRVEVGSFDTQKLVNPEIRGIEYQQGELHGYHVREYLLAKWKGACAYCGAKEVALQVEHITPRSRGGTSKVSNLTIACEPCNRSKGNQTAAEFGHSSVQVRAQQPLADAAHVSGIKTWVIEQLAHLFGAERVTTTYGYETKYQRVQVLNLTKTHAHDAVAIACEIGKIITPSRLVYQIRCVPRGSYQLYNGKHSEHKVSAPRKLYGWKLYELVEAKGQVGYIGGRRMRGCFVIKDITTGKLVLEVTHRKLVRLARPSHGRIICAQPVTDVRKNECPTSLA